MATDNNMEYDEAQAVKFIRDYMPADKRDLYDDDEIINIIDNIMGKGKSSAALQYINDNKDNRIIICIYIFILKYFIVRILTTM